MMTGDQYKASLDDGRALDAAGLTEEDAAN